MRGRYCTFKLRNTAKLLLWAGILMAAVIIIVLMASNRTVSAYQNSDEAVSSCSLPVASAQEPHIIDYADIGGERISDTDISMEVAIPANVRLDRLNVAGEICCPLEYATVSSLFGYRQNPVTGRYTFHTGYDLAAPEGMEIRAMLSGAVIKAGYDNGYGNHVVLSHEGGIETLYAHCSKLECKAGDEVRAGDTIALVGSTGNSTGNHLHVEFRHDGQRYDPEWLLGGYYD